ncbi:MAG: bifunctional phosphopantothenoylcysteine decarboxylase/phosphopantothenate--cysteine ligase CoaBC [Anaerolineae bacterium]|nr:bifunctional phosphopantothenoylcysteine decarboxylase/phosphopantothenate--cysteine ligase CoaBC [Anaerolineae bacterium]
MTILKDKHIVLGVTGSIACYKAVDLASKLTQAGALVDVILTDSATKFVTPLTFQSVTGRPVYTDMWRTDSSAEGLPTHIAHVGLGEDADLLAVIPATANTIAKIAGGFADDLLSVTALASRAPILIAPAMDGGMYQHPAVQQNIATILGRGGLLIPPDEGRFASGLVGVGRLPETTTLMGHIRRVLGRDGELASQKVVISAGGTREAIDPVRFVSNRSSGKQGHSLAQAAVDAGAREVVLVTTADLPVPVGVHPIYVESAEDMLRAILRHSTDADLLIMAAAVADFKPQTRAEQKIKKENTDKNLTLELGRTADILVEVKAQREQTGYPRMVIGFAAESENVLSNARSKLIRKGLDLLVANDITASDAGFSVDTNRVVILDTEGGMDELDLASKSVISERIIARAALMLGSE